MQSHHFGNVTYNSLLIISFFFLFSFVLTILNYRPLAEPILANAFHRHLGTTDIKVVHSGIFRFITIDILKQCYHVHLTLKRRFHFFLQFFSFFFLFLLLLLLLFAAKLRAGSVEATIYHLCVIKCLSFAHQWKPRSKE